MENEKAKVSKLKIYVIMTAIYRGVEYKSCKIELLDDTEDAKLFLNLAENGLNNLEILKIPVDQGKTCYIFSAFQLKEIVLKLEYITIPIKTPKKSVTKE